MKYLPVILLQMVAAVLIVARAEGALHVLLWCMAVSGVLSLLIPDIKGRISEAYTHCPPWWRFWAFVINTAFFSASASLGWWLLATILVLKMILEQLYYVRMESRLKARAWQGAK
ncbi:hypothetical protein ACIU3Q_000011 [Salmonella enterica subsp. enterica serovar Kokomlemle]